MMKKMVFLIIVIVFSCMFTTMSYSLYVKPAVDLHVLFEGTPKMPSEQVLRYKNTLMVPVKEFITLTGVKPDAWQFAWNAALSQLTVSYEGKKITIYDKQITAYRDSKEIKLRQIPFVYKDNLYIELYDLGDLLEKITVYEPKLRILAYCSNQMYFRNKLLLEKISDKLNSQSGLGVDINFDYGDESMFFDFKVSNENKILNGTMEINKTLENRFITEKSEIYVKGESFFVKDYKLNKWRLDDSGSFDVANSFLKAFSSDYMLKFSDIAYSTFKMSESNGKTYFYNSSVFNEYMQKELGFMASIFFSYRMIVNSIDNTVDSVSIISTTNFGSEIKSSRLDIDFLSYGDKVAVAIPPVGDFLEKNVDDIRKFSAIKKALILFLFDADKEVSSILKSVNSVDELIIMLQKQMLVNVNGQQLTFGPYLSNPMGVGEPLANYYKPDEVGKTGISINIDTKTRNVTVDGTLKDELVVITDDK